MIDKRIKYDELPAPSIVKGFVEGEGECNYEYYLLELLNVSTWFRENYGEFQYSSRQDAGQCDAYSDKYGIDFKLLISKTAMQGKSILSLQPIKIMDGVIALCECKNKGGFIKATRLHAALRGKSLDDLKNIKSEKIKKQGVENDIQDFLGTLETQKNILLFLPDVFDIDEVNDLEVIIRIVSEALNDDFKNSFLYREEYVPDYDTYLVTLCRNAFVIFKIINCALNKIDVVLEEKVKTFIKLQKYNH